MTKILVIEDEAILRSEVADWLMLEGYEALTAEDGVTGVEIANQQVPDLIICDITMPRLDGYGVLLEVHANPSTTDIPFVFVTARAAYDDIRKGMDLGADDYITKPFTRLELLHAIQTRLAKKDVQEKVHRLEIGQWEQAFEQEREQRLFKAKLVAMFSHDFRNPLSSILSSNELLRDYGEKLDESRRMKHHNRIEASVRQLLQMLDDMLLVSQIEAGHLEFNPEPLNVGEFIQGIADEFRAIYGKSNPILCNNCSTAVLMADRRLLQQIASNLISNAVKYSPQGGAVQIYVEDHDGQCTLTVRDQGIGISEEDQTRLFSAFQRGSNVGSITGTGLGLAIVKQSVELHHGSVQLESQLGSGTTVTVTIPVKLA